MLTSQNEVSFHRADRHSNKSFDFVWFISYRSRVSNLFSFYLFWPISRKLFFSLFSLCSVRDLAQCFLKGSQPMLHNNMFYMFCRFIENQKKNVRRGEKQDCENKLLMIQQSYLSTHWSLKIKWRVIVSMLLNFPFTSWALFIQHTFYIANPSILMLT